MNKNQQLATKDNIRSYYQNGTVAKSYMDSRFSDPFGRFYHFHQIKIINAVIKKEKIKNIIEVACGPGRISRHIKNIKSAMGVDSSAPMLKIAQQSIKSPVWKFQKADAFNLRIRDKYDMVITFRFIRHFTKEDRKKLYKNFHNLLRENGILIFDAVNFDKEYKIRTRVGWDKYKVYDKLYKKNELIRELKDNGFHVLSLVNCINHFYLDKIISKITARLNADNIGFKIIKTLESFKASKPMEWIVICRKNNKIKPARQ